MTSLASIVHSRQKSVSNPYKLINLIFVGVLISFTTTCSVQPTKAPLYEGQGLDESKLLQTIALGSCNRQDKPQDIWNTVAATQPDLWIWLGDNIYGDTEDMSVMLAKYQRQKGGEEYSAFRKNVPVIGTWDDHDYGVNDGGVEYPMKEASSQLMFDFLDVPKDADVRNRPGVYQSYLFGPEGKQVKIILLDTRWFRDPIRSEETSGKGYDPNDGGDLLGEAQWNWLEKELSESNAQINMVASSIQLLPEDHPYEKWANFPKSRQRFFDLITAARPSGLLVLSGDRHISELSEVQLNRDSTVFPVFELTASSMTHSWSTVGEEPNRHRVGKLISSNNFGLVNIDWSGEKPRIQVEIHSDQGTVLLSNELGVVY